MPELPEVETLRRALLPLVRGQVLQDLKFYRDDLRFPIPQETIRRECLGRPVREISRRGKYLLLHTPNGALLWHLGMSGRIVRHSSGTPREKHTHAVFRFGPDTHLHFVDPRRFGAILWIPREEGHPLIDHLGLDPLSSDLNAKTLKVLARKCKAPIKSFLMDAKRLAGIGNIYACEALFGTPLNPRRRAGRVTLAEWDRLLIALRQTLLRSIESGGTTLRDFFNTDGTPGYYAVSLSVYGKENQPCPNCATPIVRKVQSGRSTFYCRVCQRG